jgi:hypothetical protein
MVDNPKIMTHEKKAINANPKNMNNGGELLTQKRGRSAKPNLKPFQNQIPFQNSISKFQM